MLTLYGHIKTAEQQTIIQQFGDWYTGDWAVTVGTVRRGLGGLWPHLVPLFPPRCTKYNNPPINGQCTNFILFDVAI